MTVAAGIAKDREARDGPVSGSSATLLPLVYSALRLLAQRRMLREKGAHTLQPTALVHEAYLRLLRTGDVHWSNRGHFFAAAAEAMRRILIERARRARCAKHGGQMQRTDYDEGAIPGALTDERLLRLDDALQLLQLSHPRKAQVVKLRYFAGFTIEETADALSLSPTSVKLDWAFARAWLAREISQDAAK